jgi:hypothetical protein
MVQGNTIAGDRQFSRCCRKAQMLGELRGYQPASRLLQRLDLSQQLRHFVFKLRPLRLVIFFGKLARMEFEVQVAQVLVKLFFTLRQNVPGFPS